MNLDAVLPITLSAFVLVIMSVYGKLEKKIKLLFEKDMTLRRRDVVLLVLMMGVMVTVMALAPAHVLLVFYISSFSVLLFSCTYTILKKWYLAVFPPTIFVLSYLFFWNLITFNVFAFTFAGIGIVYLSGLFTWKTTLIFAGLLTALDIFQVFGTGFMGELAEKAVFNLQLPVVIMIPTYPANGGIILGLGDIFLSGLLVLQSMLRHGRRSATLIVIAIGIAMFVFEIVKLNTSYFSYFPATVVVLLGWLLGLGFAKLARKA